MHACAMLRPAYQGDLAGAWGAQELAIIGADVGLHHREAEVAKLKEQLASRSTLLASVAKEGSNYR